MDRCINDKALDGVGDPWDIATMKNKQRHERKSQKNISLRRYGNSSITEPALLAMMDNILCKQCKNTLQNLLLGNWPTMPLHAKSKIPAGKKAVPLTVKRYLEWSQAKEKEVAKVVSTWPTKKKGKS